MLTLLRRCLLVSLSGLTGLVYTQTVRPKSFSFDPGSGVSNRLITPNGDGKNDFVFFTVSNPRDSAVSGSIYDLQGKLVSSMDSLSTTKLRWDGKSNGIVVPSGIYVYVIQAEGMVFSGTVVVVK